MSTHDRLLELADTYIQRNGFQGFSYADLAGDMGIRKASIHHHFPSKTDLGLAYCERKISGFLQLEAHLLSLPAGQQRLRGYLEAFSYCADRGEMCGVHAMLSDCNLFPEELQKEVGKLAQIDLGILSNVLESGRKSGELAFSGSAEDMAVIVGNAVKGALMLNRIPPHDTSSRTVEALMQMLSAS